MKHFVIYKQSGEVVASGTSFNPEIMEDEERSVLIIDQPVHLDSVYVKNRTLIPKPVKPAENYAFNFEKEVWELDTASVLSEVLRKRANLLNSSDWTQLPDVPLATKEKWGGYRQALRDITKQAGFPIEIDWPIPPS